MVDGLSVSSWFTTDLQLSYFAKICLQLWSNERLKVLKKMRKELKDGKTLRNGRNLKGGVTIGKIPKDLNQQPNPPDYQCSIFAEHEVLSGLGRPYPRYRDAFLLDLQHDPLFTIGRDQSSGAGQHVNTTNLQVESCALEMLLANARANAYKCTNILNLQPGIMSHQIVGRNGFFPVNEDQIYQSYTERDPFSYFIFSAICQKSAEAIIDILSEALQRYDEDPEILWNLFNHQSVSYAGNSRETLGFLSDYAAGPLAVTSLDEIGRKPVGTFDRTSVVEAQNTARDNFYKRTNSKEVYPYLL